MGRGVRWGRGGAGGKPLWVEGGCRDHPQKRDPPPPDGEEGSCRDHSKKEGGHRAPPTRMGKKGAVETTAKKRGVTESPPPWVGGGSWGMSGS